MADAGAGAGAGRCLSDLSDDLLRHILFLAPDKEGASTAVLSRRWRWLWRTSGVVYLDSRTFEGEREAFHRVAEEALAAAPIKRLTFSVAEDSKIVLQTFSIAEWGHNDTEHNLMEALVSHPAARLVEQLHIEVKPWNTRCTLSFGSLPSEALRVLRITGCRTLTADLAPGAAVFPMLVDLHLQNCSVPLVDLQSIIDACPLLSTLHLASSHFSIHDNDEFDNDDDDDDDDEQRVERLLIPAVSALVLADCTWEYSRQLFDDNNASLELDVPRLQCFRYKGHVEHTNHLSLKSQASAIHVDLHLTHDDQQAYYLNGSTAPQPRELFWRFLQNFKTTKLLKLRIDYFAIDDDFALVDKASRDELLGGGLSFSLLEQLELEAEYKHGETSMVVLADLLYCCPMVRDLRIKLTKQDETPWKTYSIDMESGKRFAKSVSAFRDHRRRRSMVSLALQNDDNYYGLTGGEHSFSCLQSRLKRVSLQFFMDEPNCLGVQLAKFFAENAMVLQDMHIDDGCQEMLEHVNFSARRWIANTDNGNNQLTVKD